MLIQTGKGEGRAAVLIDQVKAGGKVTVRRGATPRNFQAWRLGEVRAHLVVFWTVNGR